MQETGLFSYPPPGVYPCILKYTHRDAPVVVAVENGKIVR